MPQLLDCRDLVLRQQFGAPFVDAELPRHRLRRRFVVAGQHDDALDALPPQQVDGVVAAFPRAIRRS